MCPYLISLCEKGIGWIERKCYEQTDGILIDFILLFWMNAGLRLIIQCVPNLHLRLLMYLEYSCVIVLVFPSKWYCLDVTINQFNRLFFFSIFSYTNKIFFSSFLKKEKLKR